MNYQMRKMAAYCRLMNMASASEFIQNGDFMEKQALPLGLMARGGASLVRRLAPRAIRGIGHAMRRFVPPVGQSIRSFVNKHPYASLAGLTLGAGSLRRFGMKDGNANMVQPDPSSDYIRGLRRAYYAIPGVMPGNNPTWDEERGL